ncbi:MAG TPA: hypothetical protein VES95_01910 [Dermatophilaceae bacterium]|nr:hypothetical protein [Dermatophilaceae bacterium]
MGEEITLFDRRGLAQAALPSAVLDPRTTGEWTGSWFELQDDSGRPRYRRPMPHPLLLRSEGPEEEGGAPRTVIWAPQRGAFSLVVPDVPEGDVVVFASPVDRPDVPQPAGEILRVPLRAPTSGSTSERSG